MTSASISTRTLALFLCGSLSCGSGANLPGGGDDVAGDDVSSFDTGPDRAPGVAYAVTRPVIIAPTPAASREGVGVVPGKGRIEADGSFSYSIPIDVPAGRAGMQPGLSLEYSSHGANGPVGMGWQIAGGSAITRCDRVPAAGGVRRRVELAAGDGYCLDGQQLVLVAGTAGEVGAEYRTEVERFTRVKLINNNRFSFTWTAELKDGRTATYQSLSYDSQFFSPLLQRNADGAQTLSMGHVDRMWPLTKVTDRAGNVVMWDDRDLALDDAGYARSHATQDNDQPPAGIPLPGRILYTQCGVAPCNYDSGTRRVDFTYETRPATDTIQSFVSGLETLVTRRLIRVTTSVKVGTTWVRQRYHKLTYIQSQTTGRSLLRTVTLCDGVDVCGAPTTFGWDVDAGAYETKTGSVTGFDYAGFLNQSIGMEMIAYDADGDGNDDVVLQEFSQSATATGTPRGSKKHRVVLADGGGFFKSVTDVDWPANRCAFGHLAAVTPVDLDGNGRLELVHECGEDGYRVLGWDDTARTLSEQAVPTLNGMSMPGWPVAAGQISPQAEGLLKFGDLDGDGLPDLIKGDTYTGATWTVRRARTADQAGTVPDVSYEAARNTRIPSIGPPDNMAGATLLVGESTAMLDQDGDGHAELTLMDFGSAMRSYSWTEPPNVVFSFRDDRNNVAWKQTTSANPPVVPAWSTPSFSAPTDRGYWYFVDVNGDGLEDGLYREDDDASTNGVPVVRWQLRINTGTGYLEPTDVGPAAATLVAYAADIKLDVLRGLVRKGRDNGLRIGDMNGDGRDDLVLFDPGGTKTSHWSGYEGTTAPIRILHSNGTGFDAPVTLPVYPTDFIRLSSEVQIGNRGGIQEGNPRWPMSTLADVDGNGLMDIVELVAVPGSQRQRRLVTQSRTGPARRGVDLMSQVLRDDVAGDGRLQHEVRYDLLSAGSERRGAFATDERRHGDTHARALTSVYPQAVAVRGTVVRWHRADIAGRRAVSEDIRYEGGRQDVTGRGFLGFDAVERTDLTTGVTQRLVFDLSPIVVGTSPALYRHYPRAGQPIATSSSVPATGSGHDSTLVDAAGAIPLPHSAWVPVFANHPLRMTSEQRATYDGVSDFFTQASSIVTTTTYDAWGNATVVETGVKDATAADPRIYATTVTTTFDNLEPSWRLGEATRVVERYRAEASADPLQGTGNPGAQTSNRTTAFGYDSNGLLKWVWREPQGGASSEHNLRRVLRGGSGLVSGVISWLPTGVSCASTANCATGQTCYDTGLGTATNQCYSGQAGDTYVYDTSGSAVEGVTNPLGHTRWSVVDPRRAWVYATVDPNGIKTLIKRDGFGRVREVTADPGAKTTVSYERRIVRRSELDGAATATFYDALGRPELRTWSTFEGGSGVERFQYDGLGNRVRTRYQASTSTHATIAASRDTALAAAVGSIITQSAAYDTIGRLYGSRDRTDGEATYDYAGAVGTTTVTDPSGLVTTTVRDIMGRVMDVTERSADGAAGTTSMRYYATGALGSIKGPTGLKQYFSYDDIGRPIAWRAGSSNDTGITNRWTAVYDSLDRPTTIRRHGLAEALTYDAIGRVTRRASAGETQTYEWDAANAIGQRKRIATDTGGGHETVFTYDTLGRRTERRDRFAAGTTSLSFGYGYDAVGRMSTLRYPEATGAGDVSAATHTAMAGPKVRYNYTNGQLRSITEEIAGNPVLWEATRRHVKGMVTEARYGTALTTSWTYEPDTLMLESQVTAGVTSGPVPDQFFRYYENGKLLDRRASTTFEWYEYDGSRGFLSGYHRNAVSGAPRTIDAVFNYGDQGITGVDTTASNGSPDWPNVDEVSTFESNALRRNHQILTHKVGAAAASAYAYDTYGRVIDISEGATVKRHYDWGSFNVPTRVQQFGPDLTRTFAYDGLGARVRKTQDANNEVLYMSELYEARNLTALNARESVYRLVADVGVVAELVHPWGQSTRTVRHLFTDQQGSPAYQVVGTTSTQLGFFPFGKRMGTAPAQSFSQLGYTGHRQDDDLGLVNMNGRIYDVATRRFLTRDLVPDMPFSTFGANAYAYVGNDPINRTDPTGFATSSPSDARKCGQCGPTSDPQWEYYGNIDGMDFWEQVGADESKASEEGTAPADTGPADGGGGGDETGGGGPTEPPTPTQPPDPPAPPPLRELGGEAMREAVARDAGASSWPHGYSYVMEHGLGSVRNGVSAEGASYSLQRDPNAFFPFVVQPVGMNQGEQSTTDLPDGIELGGIYDLQGSQNFGQFPSMDTGNFVTVTEVTPTSFTFTTMPGHFDGPGGTIKFETHEEGGTVYLRHVGNAPNTGLFAATLAPVGAWISWTLQSAGLAIHEHIGQRP